MRKTVSPIQLAANRRNAKKSTGPKTANGKAVSKMNAFKHGALAKTLVVRSHKLKESANELRKLCQEFYAELAPVGPLEESLVDQIIQAHWRLRRVRKAEAGEIALSVDTNWWQRQNRDSLRRILDFPETIFSEPLFEQLQRTRMGCSYLVHCFSDLRKSVEEQGELSETALNRFKLWLRNRFDPSIRRLEEFRLCLQNNPEKLEPEALLARHKEEVLKFIDTQIHQIGYRMDTCEDREQDEEEARQSADLLPPGEKLDRILRYETSLERQFFRAMNQLERLQRRRMGEPVPVPVAMDISRL
ncbi:MAG TPA: hypothetical protein VFV23_14620 [Verrucomicrobiae bacterium]|nr:hypothetical protein [Verrucomicrobiae bacterium]